ncbi:MAG: UMP kinase [Candidatus Moraniibacteriota bacterium]
MKNLFVISLGGSLIVPDNIDWHFLKKFKKTIIEQIKRGDKFVIVAGGGDTARRYQKAANKVSQLTEDDQDWLGVHATRLNAHLIKTIFRKYAHPRINKNPQTKEDLNQHFDGGEGIMVAAGWRPGWSTDYVATILAERLSAKKIINLSNIEYVYNKDPRKYPDATKFEEISWQDFRKIVGDKWDPGLNTPFDPIASKNAQRLRLEVFIINGKNTKNLEKLFSGKKYTGTKIS